MKDTIGFNVVLLRNCMVSIYEVSLVGVGASQYFHVISTDGLFFSHVNIIFILYDIVPKCMAPVIFAIA